MTSGTSPRRSSEWAGSAGWIIYRCGRRPSMIGHSRSWWSQGAAGASSGPSVPHQIRVMRCGRRRGLAVRTLRSGIWVGPESLWSTATLAVHFSGYRPMDCVSAHSIDVVIVSRAGSTFISPRSRSLVASTSHPCTISSCTYQAAPDSANSSAKSACWRRRAGSMISADSGGILIELGMTVHGQCQVTDGAATTACFLAFLNRSVRAVGAGPCLVQAHHRTFLNASRPTSSQLQAADI
jgi:hypothetical protein